MVEAIINDAINFERTKEGLAAARAKGKVIGRPKGVLGRSKLDGKEAEIRLLLSKEVSKSSISRADPLRCFLSRSH